MVRAAYRPANLTEQTQYFEGLRSLEDDNPQERGRSRRNRSNTGRNDRNNNKNDNNKGLGYIMKRGRPDIDTAVFFDEESIKK